MMRLLAIWRRSIFSPQRSDSGNRRSPLFHTIPLISAASYPKPHGFAIQDYPIFYSARRLYDLKSPMEAEDLAHPKLVSDLDFHNIIYATMIARYGKAVMDASKEAPEWAMC